MTNPVYEAAIYSREVTYKNLKGEEKTVEVNFALDPIQLLELIARQPVTTKSRSKDPRKQGTEEVDDGRMFAFLREIADISAGEPSWDGEQWLPIPNFSTLLAGKAFITKLTSSDADRQEFIEKVMLAPFAAFVEYAKDDPTNSKEEIAKFEGMLAQFKRIFSVSSADETLEARKARLAIEMAELERLTDPEGEA